MSRSRNSVFENTSQLVRRHVNLWDPLALIEGGAPEDEYDSIVHSIVSGIINTENPTVITDRVLKLLEKDYGLSPPSSDGLQSLKSELSKLVIGLIKDSVERNILSPEREKPKRPSTIRDLTQQEKEIIEFLLRSTNEYFELSVPDKCRTMDDGEMGSITFDMDSSRLFGQEIARAEYKDSDGIIISITLNIDSKGSLFELDFWKIDFSKLVTYPKTDQINITTANSA